MMHEEKRDVDGVDGRGDCVREAGKVCVTQRLKRDRGFDELKYDGVTKSSQGHYPPEE